MKKIFLPFVTITIAVIFLLAGNTNAAAENKRFYPPQTEAEEVLNKALLIEETLPARELQNVIAWLDGNEAPRSNIYKNYFTRNYLKNWSNTQTDMVSVCKKNTTLRDGVRCEPHSLTCNNFASPDLPYGYHTLENNEETATIALLPLGWEGNGSIVHMIKEKKEWKIDSTECDKNNALPLL